MNRRSFLGGLASALAVGLGVGRARVAPVLAPAAPIVVVEAAAAPAALEWGASTWRASFAFMQGYRLQMLLGGRFELDDAGMVVADPFPCTIDGTNVLGDPFPFDHDVWAERLQRRSRGRLGTYEARAAAVIVGG